MTRKLFSSPVLIAGCFILVSIVFLQGNAVAQVWSGGGATDDWSDPANWVGGVVPNGIAADVTIGAPSPTDVDINLNLNSLTVDANGVVNIGTSLNLDFGGGAATSLTNQGAIVVGNNADLQLSNDVVNSGQMTAMSNTRTADLEVRSGGATLKGGGTITLDTVGGAKSRITGSGGDALVVEDQTIEGHGSLGINQIQLNNQANGLIDANDAGKTLRVDLTGANTNAGTMRASNGGILNLHASGIDNTGGTIEAQDASVVALSGGTNIANGTLTTSGSGSVRVTVGQQAIFNNVTNNGLLVAENNADLEVDGTMTNNANIRLESNTLSAQLEALGGAATLTGGGTVTMDSFGGARSQIFGTGGQLIVADQTIDGFGDIGKNTLSLDNQANGLIDANVSGQSIFVDLNASPNTNAGTMQASGGGTLTLSNTDLDNTGGLIRANNGSTVQLSGTTNITGGTVIGSGTGVVRALTSANTFLTDLNLNGNYEGINNSDTGISGMITNNGTMSMIANSSRTDLEVQSGGATLKGAGKVVLDSIGGARGRITAANVGNKLTVQNHTIEGFGDIGDNALSLDLQGPSLIDANDSANSIFLDLIGTEADNTNTGTIQASNMGTLTLNNTSLGNAGGVIQALDGSSITVQNSRIVGGELTTAGTGQIFGATSANNEFENVTQSGDYVALNNSDTRVIGTLTNTGNMNFQSFASATDLEIASGGATITGGGDILLDSLGGARSGINAVTVGDLLTLANQTVSGYGNFGQNTLALDNQGSLIDANVSGESIIMDLNDAVNPNTNTGTFRASNGANFRLLNTGLDNTGGLLEVQDGSTFEIVNSNVVNGTLTSGGSGTFFSTASSNTNLENVTLNGTYFGLNNSDTGIIGTLTNTGQLTMQSSSSSTDLEVQTGGATLAGGGTTTLTSIGGARSRINGVTVGDLLTISNQTVEGFGDIGQNVLALDLQAGNVIDANVTGSSIVMDLNGGVNPNTNAGTMQASNGGTFQLLSTELDNTGGVLQALDGSTFEISNSTISGGTLTSSGSGSIVVSASSNSFLSDLTMSGNMVSLNNSDTGISGTITNSGTMTMQSATSVTDLEVQAGGATLTGGGTTTLTSIGGAVSGINGVSTPTLTVQDQLINGYGNIGQNTMNFDFQAGSTLDADVAGQSIVLNPADVALTNGGTFRASNGSTLQVLAELNNDGHLDAVDSGATIIANSLVNNAGGLMTGNGTINALDNIINNDGTIAPGNSAGELTLDGDAFFGATSVLEIELASDINYDVLDILGTADLDGILSVSLIEGFTPDSSDVFTVLGSNMLSGEFANAMNGGTVLTANGAGLFDVTHISGGVQLSGFTAVPEPGSASVLIGLAGIALMRRRRKA